MSIRPIDREALRKQVAASEPVPNFCIDDFLEADFAEKVFEAFPTLDQARQEGRGFNAVNEKGKIQITDPTKFPQPIRELHETLASPEWLETLGYIMDIPDLQADPELVGGGIHVTGPRGHLDVHVDFNYIPDRQLHRRLNILIYLNQGWQEPWGGNFELWDEQVKKCYQSFSPKFNRCCVFETNEKSFHGVTAVTCPPDQMRRSFAAYYYTTQAPEGWDGAEHSTIFRARPDEKLKGSVLMPLEAAKRGLNRTLDRIKHKIRG